MVACSAVTRDRRLSFISASMHRTSSLEKVKTYVTYNDLYALPLTYPVRCLGTLLHAWQWPMSRPLAESHIGHIVARLRTTPVVHDHAAQVVVKVQAGVRSLPVGQYPAYRRSKPPDWRPAYWRKSYKLNNVRTWCPLTSPFHPVHGCLVSF